MNYKFIFSGSTPNSTSLFLPSIWKNAFDIVVLYHPHEIHGDFE